MAALTDQLVRSPSTEMNGLTLGNAAVSTAATASAALPMPARLNSKV